MSEHSLSIAFRAQGGDQWSGGYTYQKYFLDALGQYAQDVEVHVVSNDDRVSGDPQVRVAGSVTLKEVGFWGRAGRLPNRLARRVVGYDPLLRRAFQSQATRKIDVIFPDSCTIAADVATLAWIPDFQHLHLPEMFTQSQVNARNQGYKRAIKQATLVVLSSRNAQDDFDRFVPKFSHKGRVMSFVASVPSNVLGSDPMKVAKIYNLPQEFVFLPNQFWKHKNHLTVIEALRILRARNVKPFLVCSGNVTDNRNPAHLADLMQQISINGLREQVAILGLIPHDHVLSLLRQSKCVLNPSLFEGWSTTVEEAKSVGKRVLLSEIKVHREQNPPGGVFFDPSNSGALSDKLEEVWNDWPPGPDSLLEGAARKALPERMREYAETFKSIAREAVEIKRRRK